MTSPFHTHDALIYLMVTMSAVDKAMNDAELARIGRLVTFLPVFKGFDEERLDRRDTVGGGTAQRA
jgi:hypothetical protein